MSDKLFEVSIDEVNGEQEYTHYFLIKNANNITEAEERASSFARMFYYDDNGVYYNEDEDAFEFFGGQIVIYVGHVMETTKEQWINNTMNRMVI